MSGGQGKGGQGKGGQGKGGQGAGGPLLGRPWPRLVRAQWAPLLALAALALVTAALMVAVPASTAAGYDRAAAEAMGRDGEVVVAGRAITTVAASTGWDENAMAEQGRKLRELLGPASRETLAGPEPSVAGAESRVVGDHPIRRRLTLVRDPGTDHRVRYVAGAPPRTGPGGPLAVALPKATADRLSHRVGDEIELTDPGQTGGGALRVRIGGLYEPVDAGDPYWTTRRLLLSSEIRLIDQGVTEIEVGAALVDATGLRALLRGDARVLTYQWRFPLRREGVTTGRAERMGAELEAFRTAVRGAVEGFPVGVDTPLDQRLRVFQAQMGTARVVVSLAFSGLVAVVAGALLLAAGLVGDRIRPALALMRARGASLPHLAAPAAGPVLLAVLPAAVAGTGLGALLAGGPVQAWSFPAVAGLALLAVALPLGLLVRDHAGPPAPPRRPDLASVRPSKRRLVLEALVVAVAGISVVLLRRRGLAGQTELGMDPLIAAVPVLLGVAAGLLALRVYPYPLRLAARILHRGRSTVRFLGAARAARGRLVTALPLVVLVLAATVAGFTTGVGAALERGQEDASWYQVGADARVAADQFTPGIADRMRSVRGVTGTAQARVISDGRAESGSGSGLAQITIIAVDLDAYRRVAGDAARYVPAAPEGDGALVSPAAARQVGSGALQVSWHGNRPLTLARAGRVTEFPGQDRDSAFLIVPYRLLTGGEAYPNTVFVRGRGADQKALRETALASTPAWARAAVSTSRIVRTQEAVHKELAGITLVRVVDDAFASGAATAVLYGALTVALVLVVGARARSRAIAHLQVLGVGRRQRRALAVLEAAPPFTVAVATGWTLGTALPWVTGPLTDLRAYTGGFRTPAVVLEPSLLLGPVAAVLLAASAAAAVDRAFDARDRLATVLRAEEAA
ncbi:FtsX-like permease family protein [Spirillospora sp. NPDC050679]